jgi:hypothetical protein
LAKTKKKTPCDSGQHKLFDTLGGDQICALGCGYRVKDAGEQLKQDGMERAKGARDIQEWKEEFNNTVAECAKNGLPFTSEHITMIVGLPRKEVEMNANNAVGAMMNGAAKRGVIKKTGRRVSSRRPTSHGAELTEWMGA